MRAKNLLKSKSSIGSVLISLSLLAQPAEANTFGWSFSNVVGGISGTVSGILEVPVGNDVAATSVVLTSTSNPIFNSLIGFDFVTLDNFQNRFNVEAGQITASFFGTDYFSGNTNLSLELNSDVFGDDDSPNLGLLTTAGNPLLGACPSGCLQTAQLSENDNAGQTQFAPVFTAVPEPLSLLGATVAIGFGAAFKRSSSKNAKKLTHS
jgi:hypothetical protein